MNKYTVQIEDGRGQPSTTTIEADLFKLEAAGIIFLKLVGSEPEDPRGLKVEQLGFVSFKNLVLIEQVAE